MLSQDSRRKEEKESSTLIETVVPAGILDLSLDVCWLSRYIFLECVVRRGAKVAKLDNPRELKRAKAF